MVIGPSLGPSAADTLVDTLVQSSFATMAVLNKVAAEHDLSLTQLRVLGILRDRRLRMTELSAFLGLDKSTLTGVVARAEARGLLGRAANPGDGRAVDVFMTKAGVGLAERIYLQVAQELAPLTGRLPGADHRRLQSLLARMLAS